MLILNRACNSRNHRFKNVKETGAGASFRPHGIRMHSINLSISIAFLYQKRSPREMRQLMGASYKQNNYN